MNKHLLYFLVFISAFKPYMLNHWDLIDNTINVMGIVLFVLFFFAFVRQYLQFHKVSRLTVLIFLMLSIVFFSTVSHNGNIKHWGIYLISMGTITLFLELNINDIRGIIKTWFPLVEIFLVINFITILTGGIENEDWLTDYFLGSKNTFEVVFPTFLLIIYLYQQFYRKNKEHSYICYVIILFSILLTRSTTMILELVAFCMLMFFKNMKFAKRFVNYKFLFFVYIGLSIVVFLYIISLSNSDILLYLDNNTEKGSSSLSARFRMWAASLEIISDYPLFGIGKMSEMTWDSYVHGVEYKTQLHNQLIEYFATGGLALFLTLLYFYYTTAKNLENKKGLMLPFFLSVICFSLNVGTLSEAHYGSSFYFPFLITAYLTKISENVKSKTIIKRSK